MDQQDFDEDAAAARLQAILEEHVAATETMPPEVGQAARDLYQG